MPINKIKNQRLVQKIKKQKKYSTNKAVFEIYGNRLIKKYTKIGDAVSDYQLLKTIQKTFNHQKKESWNYRALKVFDNPTKNSIEMEYIPGKTIRKAFANNRNPQIYYHMGKWLGILHKSTKGSDFKRVITFRDFADVNFILVPEKKVAVAVDPGNYKNIMNHPSISIMTGAFSIQRGVLKGSSNYIKVWQAIYYYLLGYLKGSKRKSLPLLKKGIKEVSRRQKVLWHYNKKLPLREKVIRSGEIISLIVKIKFLSFLLRINNVQTF